MSASTARRARRIQAFGRRFERKAENIRANGGSEAKAKVADAFAACARRWANAVHPTPCTTCGSKTTRSIRCEGERHQCPKCYAVTPPFAA